MRVRFFTAIAVIVCVILTAGAGVRAVDAPVLYGIREARDILKDTGFKDISRHWAGPQILKCAALRIMDGVSATAFKPQAPITREQVVAVLVRLMGLEEEARRAPAPPAGAAGTAYSGWAYGYIVTAGNHRWIDARDVTGVAWTEPAARQELAAWAAKALGLAPVYGGPDRVLAGYKDADEIDDAMLPYVAAVIPEGIMAGTAQGFFSPKANLTRGEMAAVAARILPRAFKARGIETVEGTIMGATARQTANGPETVYRLKKIDGSLLEIVTGNDTDLLVLKHGTLGGTAAISPGMRVMLTVDRAGNVLLVEALDSAKSVPGGTIKHIDYSGPALTVEGYDGKITVYAVDPAARVFVGAEPASFEDLQVGQEVELTTAGGRVVAVSCSFYGTPGVLPGGERVVAGVINDIDVAGRRLSITGLSGETFEFSIEDYTRLTLNGATASLSALSPGEGASVYTAGPHSQVALRVESYRTKQRVTAVLRGMIERVIPRTGEIMLSRVKREFYGSWVDDAPHMTIPLAPGAKVYSNGAAISLEELARTGSDGYIYLAVSSGLGTYEVIKAVTGWGDEATGNGKVEEFDGLTGEIRVGDGYITLNGSSIVVRNGVLVDSAQLQKGDHVFYIANESDSNKSAAVARVEDPYPAGYEFFSGELDEVLADGFVLSAYSRFDSHEWSSRRSRRSTEEFRMDRGALVLDTSLAPPGFIDTADFLDDRNYHHYYGWEVYAVVRDGRALGVGLWQDRPGPENTSLGIVEAVNAAAGSVTLRALKDWSAYRDKWDHRIGSLEVFMNTALILKDGIIVEVDDLSRGDVLYLIRDNNIGIIAVVQGGWPKR